MPSDLLKIMSALSSTRKKNSSPRVLCLWLFLIAHSFSPKSNGFAVSMHFRLMPVLASAHRRKALFLILVQLCTCRDSVIYHQKVQSLMTVFLVYC